MKTKDMTTRYWALKMIAFSSFADFDNSVEWGQWCRNVARSGLDDNEEMLAALERKLTKQESA